MLDDLPDLSEIAASNPQEHQQPTISGRQALEREIEERLLHLKILIAAHRQYLPGKKTTNNAGAETNNN